MTRKPCIAWGALGSCALFLFLALVQSSPAASNANVSPLHEWFDREWQYTLSQSPVWASQLGDRRWNDRWDDLSLEAIGKRQEHQREALIQLRGFDRSRLSASDQLNYDLYQKQLEVALEEIPYRWHLVPLTQSEGVQTMDDLAESLRFESVKDYEDWIARLRSFPVYLEQTEALMREGVRARVVHARVTMQRLPAQLDKQIVAMPEASPFYKPLRSFPASVPEPERERLRAQARAAIAAGVIPGFRRFKQFFTAEYLPACFEQVGAWQLPDGERYYAFLARKFTTTKLTPGEIHEIGLKEVARIRAEMLTVMSQTGFHGTLPEFFKFLRTDPRFYFKSGEELLTAYRSLCKRVDPRLVKVFRTLPRLTYGVEPIPDNIAPDTTAAYYRQPAADGSRAGTFFLNLYKPETRPRFEMMALSLHESVPGHHLQIALAMEQGDLPSFRRYGETTAFVEGWGLYSEALGEEMGLYDDPYLKFGQLTYEMWRAVRLVVDTGMHQMRWTRQQAIDYFLANAARPELDVVNEIDRYISWPGQALAYKIGQLKIKELRDRAQQRLGARFDLREFHDVILLAGALPLDLLEQRVDEWLKKMRFNHE